MSWIADLELEGRTKASLTDIAGALFGDFIGRGQDRNVYVCKLNPDWVVKLSCMENQNVIEWEAWQTFQFEAVGKFLAPCVAISVRGDVLIQHRTSPIPPGKEPKQLPSFLCDIKPDNFGLLNGRVVAHDYGTVDRLVRGANRMRSVRWR